MALLVQESSELGVFWELSALLTITNKELECLVHNVFKCKKLKFDRTDQRIVSLNSSVEFHWKRFSGRVLVQNTLLALHRHLVKLSKLILKPSEFEEFFF